MLTTHTGATVPLICGPMYPCSNPELVAAASDAGAIGIVQPISLTYVYGYDFRAGLQYIRSLTSKPIGVNALIEQSSATYRKRSEEWLRISLEEGVRFFITSLGNPNWVVDMVHPLGGIVYHDTTEAKWAEKAARGGVDGLIAVNRRAGGHAGSRSAEALLAELQPFGLPVVAAGGVGNEVEFRRMLDLGYAGVQCGTRFIATQECKASDAYKAAILRAHEQDIVLTERLTGVPVAVINTPWIQHLGSRVGPIARRLLQQRRTRGWVRTFYALRAIRRLKKAALDPAGRDEYWQAGASVETIDRIETVRDIVSRFAVKGDERRVTGDR